MTYATDKIQASIALAGQRWLISVQLYDFPKEYRVHGSFQVYLCENDVPRWRVCGGYLDNTARCVRVELPTWEAEGIQGFAATVSSEAEKIAQQGLPLGR